MRVGVVGFFVLTPLHLFFGWGGPDVPSLSRLGMSGSAMRRKPEPNWSLVILGTAWVAGAPQKKQNASKSIK